jgi:hypothetical protein
MGTSLCQLFDRTRELSGCKKSCCIVCQISEDKFQIVPVEEHRSPFALASNDFDTTSVAVVDLTPYCVNTSAGSSSRIERECDCSAGTAETGRL